MLTLTLKNPTGPRIDARGLTPGRWSGSDDLAQVPLAVGNRRATVGALFDLEGDPRSNEWTFTGDCSRLDHVGQGLGAGRINVLGAVGRHCGAGMRAGQITVAGSAGDWLGGEMRGGEIRVRGNAGRGTGGGYTGAKFGMQGGAIVVAGRVGPEAGRRMRRGVLVAVGGCGERAGYGMRAGTLLSLGPCGGNPGLEMLRGTIGLFGGGADAPTTYRRACRLGSAAIRLLRAEVHRLAGEEASRKVPDEVTLYNGDLLRGGRGELLMIPS